MVDVGTFFYSKLSTSSELLALVGSVDHISASYPEVVTLFPYVIFRETNQTDELFYDNLPNANNSTVVVDVYVKEDSPTAIATVIYNIFKPLFWACVYNEDSPDPDPMVRHRVMRFTRPLYDGDLV